MRGSVFTARSNAYDFCTGLVRIGRFGEGVSGCWDAGVARVVFLCLLRRAFAITGVEKKRNISRGGCRIWSGGGTLEGPIATFECAE